MALKTYRRQTGLGLQSSVNCPTCSTGSYRTVDCSSGTIGYVSKTQGWNGSSSSLLAYTYVANDVVWVKDGASAAIYCVTVTGSVSDPAGTYKIDEAANGGNGAYANCTSCVVP
tara:strand:+ start:2683 stop:3024 length:342 start_codon:yes stop_codon:yes gene_type:complete